MVKRKKAAALTIPELKKAALAFFCFLFLFLPSQGEYSILQTQRQPVTTRSLDIDFELPFYPVNQSGQPAPLLTSRAALVMDTDSAVVLYAKNEKVSFLPASTVKMMTALVSFDQYSLDEVLTVNSVSDFGQDMGLVEGERITAKNLLYGLLVASANDAAQALAQNFPGGQTLFVKQMNQKARELHLQDTYYANSTGLDTDEQERPLLDFSYTTALDLAYLARAALKNETFRRMVATPQVMVMDVDGQFKHPLYNINHLLTTLPGVQGIKTGFTDLAGECLVTLVARDQRQIVVVVLGSRDRFGETIQLVNWAFNDHQWQKITRSTGDQ